MNLRRHLVVGLSGFILVGWSQSMALANSAPATAPPDIHDIRGPIPLSIFFGWWIVGGLAATAAAAGAWWWWRRRRPTPLTPEEEAFIQFETARLLLESGDMKSFTVLVSETTRTYLERRFHLQAPRQTTEEFLAALRTQTHPLLATHTTSLNRFLDACDLVKFAGYSLTREEMEQLLSTAQDVVRATRTTASAGAAPKPEPVRPPLEGVSP